MALLAVAWLTAAVARAEIVDRVVAVVDRQVITLTDVRVSLEIGLVDARDETAALDALVVRALVLAEVERYAPAEPQAEAVESRLDALLSRLGPDALQAALRRAGLDVERLRILLRQDLLVESYLAQRFSVTAMPTDEQVEEYHRARRDTFVDTAGVVLEPEVALPIARERLTAERRARLIDEWIADLRRRAQVRVYAVRP
jgi:hypothetical protein